MKVQDAIYYISNIKGAQPTGISQTEGYFIKKTINKYKPLTVLEIGLGYSLLTLWVHSTGIDFKQYIIVDSYPRKEILELLKQILPHLQIKKASSQEYLAELLSKKEKFDLIIIDGDERFDGFITDIYFSNKLLNPNGIIIIRNTWNPAIRKGLCFCLKNLPFGLESFSMSRLLPSYLLNFIIHIQGKFFTQNFCVIKRFGEDKRQWNHFINF